MICRLICLFLCLCFSSLGAEAARKICLNMIVKDESRVIEKCLESVKHLIDYWVIVDTGSKDGTQKIVKKTMKGIPGELHERPWVDFAHNRNEALQLAKDKAQYLLMIDADEYLSYEEGFSMPVLSQEAYYMTVRQIGAVDFLRIALIRTDLAWKWHGVLHEYLDTSVVKEIGMIKGVMNLCNANKELSGRSLDPQKYLKDAATLEAALKKEPENARYVFYLAQSYWAAKKLDLALKNYEKRAAMASKDMEETYNAIHSAGRIKTELGDYDGAITSFLDAYQRLPDRAEPLHYAAVCFRKMGRPLLGYLLTKQALSIPCPFGNRIEYSLYDWATLTEFANCALLTGKWQEGFEACTKLMSNPKVPSDILPQIEANLELAKQNLVQ